MKQFIKFMFAAAALTAAVSSCDEQPPVDQPGQRTGELQLQADKTTVDADGVDMVLFTVLDKNGNNVTEDAIVKVGISSVLDEMDADGYKFFTTTTHGTFNFTATYDGETSNEVVVTALNVAPLALFVDKSFIKADGIDQVEFTVMQGTEDVTELTQICDPDGMCLTDNVFYSNTLGEYNFYAYFKAEEGNPDRKKSNIVTVYVVENPTTVSFQKNVAIFNCTGSWCPPCGTFKPILKQLQDANGDKVVLVCFYNERGQTKVYSPVSDALWNEINNSGNFPRSGYVPTTAFDLNTAIVSAAPYADVNEEYGEYKNKPARTGIAVSSKVVGKKVEVAANIAAESDGTYAVGALLVEDNIIFEQANQSANYNHTNVLRTKGMTSAFGDNLGAMNAGSTIGKSFSLDTNDQYVVDNLSVVVYTTYVADNGKKYIANIVKCPVGESLGYKFAQ